MPETPQLYLGLEPGSGETATGFQGALNYIRESTATEYGKGNEFERLMKQYLSVDPLYKERFTDVYLWKEWAALRTEYDGVDTGIDLVARESNGEYCAIQCKCFAEDTRVTKPQIDSFVAASAGKLFTKRILVHTSSELGPNVRRTIEPLGSDFQVIGYGHLASRPIDWPDLRRGVPEQLDYRIERFKLRDHQQKAFRDVINGFKDSDRGKLIMACGTGKTFTALRIAEEIAGIGGRVLYLVPSLGLFSQAMREWAEQQGVQHRYIGICSDTSAGKKSEDVPIQELEIPVTTDPLKISNALGETDKDAMTVVFCTYHSLPIVESAQEQGAPAFDIVLCDEAHRTTGIEEAGEETETSPFVLVHNADRIRAKKRLYMTATPRLYTEGAKAKAARHDIEVFSMDDPDTYGPEFHRLPFSRAVEQDLLSDYKVAIFTMYEPDADATLQGYVGAGGSEINITDATKFVGCWRALQNPEGQSGDDAANQPLTRAIAFNNTIRNSKRLAEHWNEVIESAIEQMPEDLRPLNFECETQHVDGQHNAFDRKTRIEWLKGSTAGACRILSNARCLSEGIDVPALDAVIFMTPKNSHVDIVQAVGRVMRKAQGKQYGYIILPVAIPPGTDPADALNNNERFAAVWNVLRALRSHDDRLNAEINKIDLNKAPTDRILFPGGGGDGDGDEGALQRLISFGLAQIPPQDIYAKIVERCGDRKYWESWAKDVANIFQRVVVRIENLLDNPDNDALREWFDSFHAEMQDSINPSVTRNDAIDMMAQHLLTRPVFEALFENYDFASGNPVSIALDSLRNDFGEFGLENETRDLKGFYESVRMRARGIDNSEGRQRVLLELYEKFFANALKKDAERLGIVYTPVEVVDFILHSADEVLQQEFGRSLSDEGVHILDPFAGAGVFLARLLQSDLIQASDLERKYREELHANEIVLLAYYIAAVNIEEAYRGERGEDSGYEPFNGIVLTDTFNLNKKGEKPTLFPKEWLPDNNARAERQQKLPIQVIVGNPPWSAGQKSVADDNPNVAYPLSREEKLEALDNAGSISGFSDWQRITPDEHHDWIGQRSDTFAQFYPMGSNDARMGVVDNTIFGLYSRGLTTGKDIYIYNFSRDACTENAQRMTQDYLNALQEREDNPELTVDAVARRHSSNLKWEGDLKKKLDQKKKTEFEENYIRKVIYRPFIGMNCYADYTFTQRKGQMDKIFPDDSSVNRVICVPGIGTNKPFSALITDTMPDLNLNEAGAQCFPRYCYPKPTDVPDATDTLQGIRDVPDRIDNISDMALRIFCEHYPDDTITKDAIFNYVYGVLHAPSYREEFASDLSKEIPRIPFAPDFHAFAEAGKALAALHLCYETCEQYPLSLVFAHEGEPQSHHFRLTEKAMRFATPAKTTLIINEHLRLTGIPEAAHRYVVNGRTPLEWFIDRYRIKRDKESGILSDPNGWFDDPRDLVTAIERIVYVSVESTRIIESLPSQLTDDTEG